MKFTLDIIDVIGPIALAVFIQVGIVPALFLMIGTSRRTIGAYRPWTMFGFIAHYLFIFVQFVFIISKEGILPVEVIGILFATVLGIIYFRNRSKKYAATKPIIQDRSKNANKLKGSDSID